MAQQAVAARGVSVALACRAFAISQRCYRYVPLRANENGEIEDWLVALTGARKNEIATSKWDWVDWDNRVIRLPDSKAGAKPLYLSDSAILVLKTQKVVGRNPNSGYIFPGAKADGHIINLSKPWKQICEEAKLTDIRIHDLRHTAASIAVGQGVSLQIIGRLLGHSQTQTTARYAHVDNDPALAAANVVGNVLKGAL